MQHPLAAGVCSQYAAWCRSASSALRKTLAETRVWRSRFTRGSSHAPACRGTVHGGRKAYNVFMISGRGTICAAVLGFLAGACARPVLSGKPPFNPAAERTAAGFHQLIDQGCYLCLRDVVRQFDGFDEALREVPAVQDAATEAALLFVMRAKELSIPIDDDFRAAQALVDARAAESADYGLYRDVAAALPWNAIGVGEDFMDRLLGPSGPGVNLSAVRAYTPQDVQDDWRSRLASTWRESTLAAYVYQSLNCELRPQTPIDMTPVKARYASVPLIQYRWASCESSGAPTLRSIIDNNSRFYEARYALAMTQARAQQFDDAQQNDLDAWQGIPHFTAAALSYANLALSAEQFDEANRAFDAVLAIVPTHRRALLGKIESFTYLGQYRAAADGAHQMITLGHWFLGDAYYWLSLNEYHLEQIPQALEDVQTAKNYESGARVHFLAGLIRMKQQDWTGAKQEFLDTVAADAEACDALLDLGQVDATLSTWLDGAGAFAGASTCYARTRQSLEAQIAKLAQQPGPRAGRLLARRRTDLHDTVEKQGGSLYAAAVSFTNANERDQALRYAVEAEGFESYADRARALWTRLQRQSR